MIELATSAMVLLSIFYAGGAANAKTIDSPITNGYTATEDRNIVDGVALIASAGNANQVETEAREYFKDTPILAEIAGCESEFKHTGENGEIIRGKVNPGDIGVMQINEDYHTEEAAELGLDLKTLGGNMAFAKWLYKKEGVAPWQSSAGCWNKQVAMK